MQVSVEKVSNVEHRLTIVVPANQVEAAYSKQISAFAQKANIKGFRPGHAPDKLIEQRFGEDARKEALSDVIQKALYDAIVEKKLKPIDAPRVETKSNILMANQPFEFVATIEVLPEIEKIQFSLDNIEKLSVDVTAEDAQLVIDQLRKQYTKWKLVDRPAQEKDRVVIDYYSIFDGKADDANKIENVPVEIGAKNMLPGFEDGLIGLKAGDEKTLDLVFPAEVADKEKAGKPVQFAVQVKQVFEADMPAIDEAFIQRLGVKSGKLEELQTQIKQSLEQERDRLVKEKLKDQVFRQLLEQNPIEVPKSLVNRESKNIHDEVYQNQHHDHHSHSEEEMTAFNEIARKRVALGLLIGEYAKQNEIKADKDRVESRIQEIASVYENPKEVVEWLSTSERRGGIEAQVLEDQVMEKLMEGVPVTDKVMNYAELKGVRS